MPDFGAIYASHQDSVISGCQLDGWTSEFAKRATRRSVVATSYSGVEICITVARDVCTPSDVGPELVGGMVKRFRRRGFSKMRFY